MAGTLGLGFLLAALCDGSPESKTEAGVERDKEYGCANPLAQHRAMSKSPRGDLLQQRGRTRSASRWRGFSSA